MAHAHSPPHPPKTHPPHHPKRKKHNNTENRKLGETGGGTKEPAQRKPRKGWGLGVWGLGVGV